MFVHTHVVGKHPLNSLTNAFLKKFVPDSTKRLILVVSILAFIKNMQEPDDLILIELRQAFGFVQAYDSYRFPWMMSKFIWKPLLNEQNKLHTKVCEEKRQRSDGRVARAFINKMPAWLIYANPYDIERDINRLLTLC